MPVEKCTEYRSNTGSPINLSQKLSSLFFIAFSKFIRTLKTSLLTYTHGFNRGIQMRIAPLVQALREEVPSLKILTDAL